MAQTLCVIICIIQYGHGLGACNLQHSVLGDVFEIGGFEWFGIAPANRKFDAVSQFGFL